MITLKYIRDHFKAQGYVPRHDFNGLKKACNRVAKQTGEDAVALFHLLIENRPVNAFTHSYGFQTGTGRALVDSLQAEYYKNI